MKKNMQTVLDTLKNNWKVTVGVILAVIVIAFSVNALVKKEPVPVDTTPIEEVPVETPVAPARRRTTTTPVVPTVADSRAYTDVVVEYRGRTIQFGNQCQAAPSRQVFKVGTEILLDNRNATAVKIMIGSTSHDLAGYGFKAIRLSNEGTFMIDCNQQLNVATLIVQQ